MSKLSTKIETAMGKREEGKGLCLNAFLPGNLKSHAYKATWLYPSSGGYIGCDDNRYFERLQKRLGRKGAIRKALDRIVLIAPELVDAGYWSGEPSDIEVHPVPGGIGFILSVWKDEDGRWTHSYDESL